jgi:hypothetical protein
VFSLFHRASIPFVFEVPTTLDALHDLIAEYASTGADASLIIQRVHATNSVRLNHKNKERMQNYYDVLLRRFVAVGDAIFESGNGGTDLERYEQLNSLTKTLYVMSQDSPECAAAVWSRRLGIFQKGKANDCITACVFVCEFYTYSFPIIPHNTNKPYPKGYVTLKSIRWVMLAGMNSLHGHRLECCC